jgi:transcriptional regulator with PAS, ATPase and Fis domain
MEVESGKREDSPMISLELYKSAIEKVVTGISDILNVDAAVIDERGLLVVSTERYLKQKGEAVHVPSIEFVLAQGQYLVDRPGSMEMCKGCRFLDSCPAKVELLSAIKVANQPIGVVSLTSFTKEGQNRLSKQTDKYQQILTDVSEMITRIIQSHVTRQLDSQDDAMELSPIVGNSPAIRQLKEVAARIRNSSSTVLITGETGTGKGHLAKAIHDASKRAYYPFVAINCASIPENLFESELFGYEDGAFTGARKGGKPGRFELADRGTLFLDEIGDMPLSLQAKLLRVLQDKVVERIGGTRSIPVNARIIAATNQNLEELVEKKAFRADLYYRLNVIPVHVPSLAERKEDIELLALSFMKKYGEQTGRTFFGLSREAVDLLMHVHWPGNVRELENAIEYAMNMEQDTVITADSLPPRLRACYAPVHSGPAIKTRIADVQAEVIRASLQKHGSDLKGKQQVARELGIGIRTLYRKLKLLGI